MRVWNLTTLNELEAPVVGRYQEKSAPRARVSDSSRLKTTFKVAAAVVAVAGIALRFPQVSSTCLEVKADIGIVQSIPRIQPPLAKFFSGAFGGSWSAEEEQRALDAMVATHNESVEFDEEELLDVAAANQQEGFESDIPRLTPDKILRTLRKRSV